MMECVGHTEFSFQEKTAEKAMVSLRWFNTKILPAHITEVKRAYERYFNHVPIRASGRTHHTYLFIPLHLVLPLVIAAYYPTYNVCC